jgi:hypothetical protein
LVLGDILQVTKTDTFSLDFAVTVGEPGLVVQVDLPKIVLMLYP